MSDDPDTTGPDTDALAGEYVLGVLSRHEAARCAARRAEDPGFDRAVSAWERRLMPLTALVAPVPPPPDLLPRIEAAMAPANGPAARTRDPRRQIWFWRGTTAASLAVACGLAALLLARPAPPERVVTLLPPGGTAGAFAVILDGAGALRLRPLQAPTLPPGRDLQLWSLQPGAAAPRSLGVLPAAGEALPPGTLPSRDVQLLVSLEPAGGSPTGLPTGPVVLASEPPPPPR